ncbi:MAG: MBL fold metallo-hydrolase [Candidatus Binatia bacterium]
MRVTVLGSGDAFCNGGRRQSGYLVETNNSSFLLDCGVTTLLALKALHIPADTIDFVAISHLHGDHFGGLPFLFLEYLYERPRTRPLLVVGPPGTKDRVLALHRVMYRELSERPMCFSLDFCELQPEQAQVVCGAEVFPFRVPHQERDISLGYRVSVDQKSILYSGDCGWNENLVRYSQGADLFICECCYFHTQTNFHVSYPTIAAESGRLGCKRLLLSHIGREVLERLDEVTIACARDGLVIDV